MRAIKGDYGYLSKKRNIIILWTIVSFAIAISIFVIGYITTGTKRNLFTIIAVLGLLPASKNTVSMIMYLKAKGCSAEAYSMINNACDGLISMYDMYFTSYSKNYALSHMIVSKKIIIGYYEGSKFDSKECVNHLNTMLKNSGYSGFVISLTDQLDKYIDMVNNLDRNITDDELKADDEIRITLYEISL